MYEAMTEELTIKEAIKEGNLIQARKVLMSVLRNEARPESFGSLLGDLAYKFKHAGLFENAVEVLEKKCELIGDPGEKTALKHWIKELNTIGWFMARRDSHRTSRSTIGKGNQPLNFQHLWSYSFPNGPISIQETLNLPSPIIARDMLITFNESLQGFIGLEIKSGIIQWESGVIVSKLDYSMTPIYVRPYLFFVVPGSVKRISIYNSSGSAGFKTSTYIRMAPYSTPLCWGKAIVFSFLSHVFICDQENDKGDFYSVPLRDNEILKAPIVCNNDLFFLSNFGRVFRLPERKGESEMHCIKELPNDANIVYSAPCAVEDAIYFERVNKNGLRQVGCYIPSNNHYIFTDLSDEFCNTNHSHLNFAPISAGDGVLFCSDNYSRLYKIKQAGDMIEIVPINIRSQIPSTEIGTLSQIYSSTLNSYFLSKSFGGFLYINLINCIATNEIFQPQRWEMICQPIVYANKILFVCKEGVTCYEAA